MKCRTAKLMLDEYRDGMLLSPLRDELARHIESCASCSQRLADIELMEEALRNMRVAPARENFAAEAVAMASGSKLSESMNRGRRINRVGMGVTGALAAGLMAWGVILFAPSLVQRAPESSISVSLYQPRKISLAFNAPADIRGVTVSVELPKDFEVVGHSGRRSLTWKTDLKKGRNILTLPILAKGDGKGVLVTRLSRNNETKTVQVLLTTTKSGLSGNRILDQVVV